MLSTTTIVTVLVVYFAILIAIAYFTSRNADSDSFFMGNRKSSWYLIAFGMIGTSLSGVTFISVPGAVIGGSMGYFQVVLGYVLGYIVIAQILMPLYYRLNVISIYEYLQQRFGQISHKTGASFFILSRTVGSAIRLFIATEVLQLFLFQDLGVPYWLTALITILLIWIYTFRGGVKTIIYTDSFQTIFLISSVIICVFIIAGTLDCNLFELWDKISAKNSNAGKPLTAIFFFDDPLSKGYFWKQFIGGAFLAIAMTGLDQDLMQKNLTCKSIKDAKKNMYSFTVVLVITNLLFLILGGALYVYAETKGVQLPMKDGKLVTDHVFPALALNDFGQIAGIFFLLGITASSYASADSALTALTTGFCIDFLNFSKREEAIKKRTKLFVHIGFSVVFFLIILIAKWFKEGHPDTNIIDLILKLAGFTYGPLLGLFAFGIFSKRKLQEKLVPFVAILVPVLCYFIDFYSQAFSGGILANDKYVGGYQFGIELLILNGLLTYLFLWMISKKNAVSH